MDDFRTELTAVVDEMRAAGIEPTFLVVDLDGIGYVKQARGAESADTFRASATDAIAAAAGGCDTFRYGEERIVAILPGYTRLKTFALIERLRRALPLLGQSFDCPLQVEFDVLEYDEQHGVPALVAQLAALTRNRDVA
ncbi:MAG TPA: hypothetical protein VFU90_05470 [Candidatus Tumulicola sp.]|nr:hypothetical protein [Candidatus Tumulicola sp.]